MGIIRKIIRTATLPARQSLKGAIGEIKVSSKLSPSLFDFSYRRNINGLMLVDSRGVSHQIDHVEIRASGIFCIETKNLSGTVIGTEDAPHWRQLLGRQINEIGNPIRQNEGHIRALRAVLGDKHEIHSLVVMASNNARGIKSERVINLSDLRSYLNGFKSDERLTVGEIDEIYNTLKASHRGDVTKREHVKSIRAASAAVNNGLCPRCGKRLVQRSGKYGEFIGCAGFPNCKFTQRCD